MRADSRGRAGRAAPCALPPEATHTPPCPQRRRAIPRATPAQAARHIGYGVNVRYSPVLGDCLLHALATSLGEEFTPEVEEGASPVVVRAACGPQCVPAPARPRSHSAATSLNPRAQPGSPSTA